jgi:hypothetical protein
MKQRVALIFERRIRGEYEDRLVPALVRLATFDVEGGQVTESERWADLQKAAREAGYDVVGWTEYVPTGNESGKELGSKENIERSRELEASRIAQLYRP